MSDALISRRTSSFKYNLFVQPEEPTIKNGLWIQAPKKGFTNIICKQNFLISGALADSAACEFGTSSSSNYRLMYTVMDSKCYQGRYIYGVYCPSNPTVIKYDVFTGTYANVYVSVNSEFKRPTENAPYNTSTLISGGATFTVLFIGEIVYFVLDSSNGSSCLYKVYDMINDKVVYDGSYIQISSSNIGRISSAGEKGSFAIPIDDDNVSIVSLPSTNSLTTGIYTISTKTVATKVSHTTTFSITYLDMINMTYYITNTNTGVFYNGYLYIFAEEKLLKTNVSTNTDKVITCPWSFSNDSTHSHCQVKVVKVSETKLYIMTSPYYYYYSTSNPAGYYHSTMYEFDLETETFTKIMELPDGLVVNYAIYVPDHGILMACLGYALGISCDPTLPIRQYSFVNDPQPDGAVCIQNGTKYPIRLFDMTKVYNSLPHNSSPLFEQPEYNYKPDFSFFDAWLIANGNFQKYPSYTGDGKKWNIFKNPQ